MADLFEYVDDHDMRVAATIVGGGLPFGAQWPNPQIPNVQGADFYARVAANNRTRFEMKVFAMYVASDLVSDRLRNIAKKYFIFDPIVDAEWWGRGPFIQMQDYTDGIVRNATDD